MQPWAAAKTSDFAAVSVVMPVSGVVGDLDQRLHPSCGTFRFLIPRPGELSRGLDRLLRSVLSVGCFGRMPTHAVVRPLLSQYRDQSHDVADEDAHHRREQESAKDEARRPGEG
jgi:hypothetical protein